MATKTKVMRVSMYLTRKAGISSEEFNRYWSDVHGPLVRPLIQKYGILKYTQYHTSEELQKSTMDAWPELRSQPVLPYDGVAEFFVNDIKGIEKSRHDPLFLNDVRDDEGKFFEASEMVWTIGWEEVQVENGIINSEDQVKINTP